ncbi:MAG: mannitol dehydrogenase family protein [Cryobacterium sp.]|nr:mannitol dehydrogenase family protein [Cryobacterium sp.]
MEADRERTGIIHIGLGAFHRAHQAWYTHTAAPEWGITAFTGRQPRAAELLAAQGCRYTLVERAPERDRFEQVSSIVAAHAGDDATAFLSAFADADQKVVTLTVTESAYLLAPGGGVDLDALTLVDELPRLRRAFAARAMERTAASGDFPRTVPGRLLLGLEARRRAGGPPLTVVPCDNISRSGTATREALIQLAEALRPELAAWIADSLGFVDSSVDRITPRTTERDIELVECATGWHDASPVVTEPFRSWVLAGRFAAGRPEWEAAGAEFVSDVEPYERRKLWLLNGAHSLLASAGLNRGKSTVAEAIADDACRELVEQFWDEAVRALPDEVEPRLYTEALRERFSNPRIEHRLDQIAEGAVAKLRVRVLPVLAAERHAGRSGAASLRVIAEWCRFVAPEGDPLAALATLSPELADDAALRELVLSARG